MDLFAIYYYAGTPLLMCNLLFYSITTLSNSISSSQNVFKFISETAEPDYLIFKETIDHLDLMNKIDILKLFINDVIKLFCKTEEKEKEKENLQILFNEELIYEHLEHDDFVTINKNTNILTEMPESLKMALISLCETIYNISNLISKIQQKISSHKQSYIKSIVNLKLKNEIHGLNNLCKILDVRSKLFFDLTNIHLVKNNK